MVKKSEKQRRKELHRKYQREVESTRISEVAEIREIKKPRVYTEPTKKDRVEATVVWETWNIDCPKCGEDMNEGPYECGNCGKSTITVRSRVTLRHEPTRTIARESSSSSIECATCQTSFDLQHSDPCGTSFTKNLESKYGKLSIERVKTPNNDVISDGCAQFIGVVIIGIAIYICVYFDIF